MDLIAGRKLTGIICGKILTKGSLDANQKSNIAYVQATDIHIGEFTIQENLYFAAKLKFGDRIDNSECLKLCVEVANSLGLENVLHVPVGTALIKGISGGQKKRLSIAIELLDVPSILCLDEPTSGNKINSFSIFHSIFLLYLLFFIFYSLNNKQQTY